MSQIQELIKHRGGGTPAELDRVFGKFSYRESTGGGILISAAWTSQNIVDINVRKSLPGWPVNSYTGRVNSTIQVHRLVVAPLILTWTEIVRLGLHKKLHTFGGSFVPRHMLHDRSKPLSVHSYGSALDLDVEWNGYGTVGQINRDVVKVFEMFGWEWGGRWSTSDPMHFQWTDALNPPTIQPWRDTAR